MVFAIRFDVKRVVWLATWAGTLVVSQTSKADDGAADPAREQKLIQVLQSQVPPQDKAIPCKQLAIFGTKASVPALAALLSDPELASWARIALEAIPDAAADEALCVSMGKLKGKLLVGAINSLGQRRTAKAIPGLVPKLRDSDVEVASAAAVALGRIGGDQAAQALEQSLTSPTPALRSAAAEGFLLCAERSLAQGRRAEAVARFDTIRKANVPRQKMLEATRGAILARQTAGAPLLVEQLRSPDKALFGIGLRTARELAGSEVTAAVATELAAAPPDRQALLLLVLADRADAGALDAVKKYIFSNHKKVRITALSTLGLLGNASQVELLLQAAQKAPTEVPAVREALLRLRGDNVNQALIAAARSGPAISRGECLLVLSARGATEAMPLFLEGLKAKEESIRQAALSALRRVAGMSEFPELLRNLLSAEAESTRAGLQDLLVNLCRRSEKRAEGVRQLLEAWKTANGPGRLGVLEVLCWLGDPEGLAAVQAGLKDPEVDVRKRVLRALNNWPNSTIFPQLLELARSDSEGSLKVLAIRLAVPLVSRDASLTATVKADRFSQLMKLATSLEEKRLILAALKAAPGALSMALAESQLRDPALANEAAVAVADLVQQNLQEMRALLRKAAQANIDSALRQRLEKLVESLEALKP